MWDNIIYKKVSENGVLREGEIAPSVQAKRVNKGLKLNHRFKTILKHQLLPYIVVINQLHIWCVQEEEEKAELKEPHYWCVDSPIKLFPRS